MAKAGFGGRVWLLDYEWQTYKRCAPVRYVTSHNKVLFVKQSGKCFICGKVEDSRPFQVSHRVPFLRGVQQFGLTPDWLNGIDNLVLAHRGSCNKLSEIPGSEIPNYLTQLGLDLTDSPALSDTKG